MNRSYIIELIDTLWNVNSVFDVLASALEYELIDTLWNVNDSYIDECLRTGGN